MAPGGLHEALQILRVVPERRRARKVLAQDHDVVLVAEKCLGTIQCLHVAPNCSSAILDQPQRVTQRLDLLAPFMEVLGILAAQGTLHGPATAAMRRLKARCKGAELGV